MATNKRSILNETTEIAPERTAAEINCVLIQCGARSISVDYDAKGGVTGMTFTLIVNGLPHHFRMPVRTEGVKRLFKERRKKTMGFNAYKFEAKDQEQAERVAWRQLLRWTQAQLAMIEAGAAEAREIFLPYLTNDAGQTLFEAIESTRFKALPEGKAS